MFDKSIVGGPGCSGNCSTCTACYHPDVVYEVIPQYQEASATVKLGSDPYYPHTSTSQRINVTGLGIDTNSILMYGGIALAAGIILYLVFRHK